MSTVVSIFTVRINSKSFSGLYDPHNKGSYLPKFSAMSDVFCLILRIKTNSTPQCWCGFATDILKKDWIEN